MSVRMIHPMVMVYVEHKVRCRPDPVSAGGSDLRMQAKAFPVLYMVQQFFRCIFG